MKMKVVAIDLAAVRHETGGFSLLSDDKGVLHAEYDIAVHVGIAPRRKMCNERFATGRGNREMQVLGPIRVTALRSEHFADRPVIGDRVEFWDGRSRTRTGLRHWP